MTRPMRLIYSLKIRATARRDGTAVDRGAAMADPARLPAAAAATTTTAAAAAARDGGCGVREGKAVGGGGVRPAGARQEGAAAVRSDGHSRPARRGLADRLEWPVRPRGPAPRRRQGVGG